MIESRWPAGSVLLAVLTAACASGPQMKSAAAEPQSGVAAAQTEDDAVVARARRALADSGVAAEKLKLESVTPARWNDSSLGCRRPGQSYLQVITEGQIVRFTEAGEAGRLHEVHVAGAATAICGPAPAGPIKRSTLASRARNLDQVLERARTDLAARMNVDSTQVQVRNLTPAVWPDAGLDCGQPAAGAPQQVAGYKLFLEFQGRIYTYHTDLQRVLLCPPMANE